ncbi:MAG: CheY-specific phosphatase CheX [Sulfurimonas sp.]|jgi:CheY-specific phosphatase CheX
MYKNSNNLIVINFIGVMQERSIRLLISSIIMKQDIIKEDGIKAVLISLKGLIFDDNIKDLTVMVNELNKLSKQITVPICFIDYSIEFFKTLRKVTKHTKVQLFKDKIVAGLFLDPKAFKETIYVLVYDDDDENSKQLSSELSKYGYTVIRAKDIKDFQERMAEKVHNIVITHSALARVRSSSKGILALSKKLIINLPIFMDTAVETLVTFTGLQAQKSAHSIKGFDTNIDADNICAVMKFTGDLDGYFTLVFPKDIAVIALESLLGEKVEQSDNDTLKDGVGEFCNIITGSVKTAFDKKDIKVIFELPKTYTSLKDTQVYIGQNNGVWIDMQLAGKSFYMFITK